MAKILLIDDDADLSDFLRAELNAHKHTVECLARAERGPELLAQGDFDLVLLDNQMPGMSGIEFLGAMRDVRIYVPVILMTGYATSDTAIQAINLGAFDYVIKPESFQHLLNQLQPVILEALEIAKPLQQVRLPVENIGPMLVGKHRTMIEVYKLIGRFARSDDAVLILGETGTGKELVARAIHTNSARKNKPFVALNCTALGEQLLDDELFGHEQGAYTGAHKLRKGKFEHASGGTLFLDEIGDMPLNLQVKLLRLLEDQQVIRIGSNEVIKVDVRLLSATHRDLEAAIRDGCFRRDLFHRLNRVTVRLPALRERLSDLPELATYFLNRAAETTGRCAPSLADSALERLEAYPWPGNIRELQNILYRAAGVCRGPQILPIHLDLAKESSADVVATPAVPTPPGLTPPVSSEPRDEAIAGLHKAIQWAWNTNQPNLWPLLRDLLERELLQFTMNKVGGNQTEAARRLEMARGTVIKRIQDYGQK